MTFRLPVLPVANLFANPSSKLVAKYLKEGALYVGVSLCVSAEKANQID